MPPGGQLKRSKCLKNIANYFPPAQQQTKTPQKFIILSENHPRPDGVKSMMVQTFLIGCESALTITPNLKSPPCSRTCSNTDFQITTGILSWVCYKTSFLRFYNIDFFKFFIKLKISATHRILKKLPAWTRVVDQCSSNSNKV